MSEGCIENGNLFIRHTPKVKAHKEYSAGKRIKLGARDEFATLIVNPKFRNKIERLRKKNKLNIMVFDDYITHGNSFNVARNLLESLGANKIIFVSVGSFDAPFQKKNYKIKGSVYEPGYTYELLSEEVILDVSHQYEAKREVGRLLEIFEG